MNMCFLTASVSRSSGGLLPSLQGLARGLITSGCQVTTLGEWDTHAKDDLGSWAPVPVQTFPVYGPERFSFAPGFHEGLRRCNPDMLHLHGLWRYTSVATLRWHRSTRRPYVVHPHGMLDPWAVRNSRLKKVIAGRLFENKMLRQASCIRALCQPEAEAIRRYGCSNPICIIPNGIDLPKTETRLGKFNPSLTECQAAGRKILLYLGRIHPKKGLVNLIKAWIALQQGENSHAKGWVLAIAGWDELGHENALKSMATELGGRWCDTRGASESANLTEILRDTKSPTLPPVSLVFLGPQFGDQKNSCYRACDAFILPSLSEGVPMTVLEAWSYRKPVVMTRECNLPEGFSAGAAIEILADPSGMSQGLQRLLEARQSELNEIGAKGLVLVEREFDWNQVAVKFKQVCEWLVKGGTKPDWIQVG